MRPRFHPPRPPRLRAFALLATLTLAASVLPAQTAPLPTTLPASTTLIAGQTEPSERVEVPSVLRGQLIRVSTKEGQAIKKGDEIAQLDDTLQKMTVALAQLEADSTVEIRQAEANIDYAKNDLARYRSIPASSQSIPELKQRELAVKQSELKLEATKEAAAHKKIELAREQATLEKMTIRAPLDGSVLRINKQPGELVDVDKPVAVVVQTNKLHARFYPPKQLFGKIKVGDKVSIELKTEPPITRQATVIVVDPILDVASQLFQVKMELDNVDQAIPAGTTATWTWAGK